MQEKKSIVFLFIFFLLSSNSFSQLDSTTIQADESINNLLDESFEETDNSDLYDFIEELLTNPIDLNNADIFELQKIPYLDQRSAELIISYRNRFGKFFALNELYAIREINKDLIQKVIPFLKIGSQQTDTLSYTDQFEYEESFFSKTKINLRSRYGNDLQTRRGFEDGSFEGSKLKSYNRLLLRYSSKVQAGILIEKDAGERKFNEFNSFHLQIKDFAFIKNFVAGDYSLEFGQGLALWSPYGFSKGADAIYPVKKRGKNIKPYTSATEYDFLRGAAATISLNNLDITFFYSSNNIDASIDTVANKITSINSTGLHRTESEIRRKSSVKEQIIGGRIEYQYSNLIKTGFTAYNSKFNLEFLPETIYDISGDNFRYYSFDYDFNYSLINLFGEFVYNEKSVASLNGINLSVSKSIILTTSLRSYPRNYINLHGFGFGEQSGRTQNEFGIYTGLKWNSPVGIINLYFDQFRFPYQTFENPIPSTGKELFANLSSRLGKGIEFRLRYKIENKEVTDLINEEKKIVSRERQSIRTELIFELSKYLRLKGRVEFNRYAIDAINSKENGFLVFQDVRYAPVKDLLFYGRIIFFRTDSFNSAVYEYENDLTGILTNLAMYGEGIRWYLVTRYKPIRYLTLSLKYSETYKPSERTLSSGDNEITGNTDNRISFQLDFNF